MWVIITLSVVSGLLLVVAGLLFISRRDLAARRAALEADLAELRERAQTQRVDLEDVTTQRDSLRERLAERDRDIAVLNEKQEAARQRMNDLRQQYEQVQKQAREAFDSIAGRHLEKASKQFLQLADQKLKGEQKDATAQLEQRKQAIEALLKPIRESLDKHAKAVADIEKTREGAYHALRQQLGTMAEGQQALRDETGNLVKALRRPEVRGRWGEMQLRRVAELAGMIAHCDFTEQASVSTEDSRLRPDMVVHLPAGRNIVVDAKTPISAFIEAVESSDEASRAACLARHVKHIEQQVRSLSSKGYVEQFERTPDFVVLFIPGESFLHAAAQQAPDLIERAMNAGVVIATPTTLVSLLKAVAMGWREERVAESAAKIQQLGQELHERIGTMVTHVERLGGHLENASKAYNQFVGSLDSRVLVTARKFKELGADSPKELPAEGEVKLVEATVREVKRVEAGA